MGWVERQLVRLGLRSVPEWPNHHTKAVEIRDRLPSEWDQYFTFGFVRNPWSWQVSLYFYMLQNEDHWFHEKVKAMDGFEDYVNWRVQNDRVLQSSFFCDENGEFIVDFIGRLENIHSDFRQVCEQIGAPASLPRKNESSHKNYQKYYNQNTKKIIKNHFKKDIINFGYSFSEVEQKNEIIE
jgi:hypothetical protein